MPEDFYVRPEPHSGVAAVRKSLTEGWLSLPVQMFGAGAEEDYAKEDEADPHVRKPAYKKIRVRELTLERQTAFNGTMRQSISDGLRPLAIQAATANYIKIWNEQPWWWRRLHWRMSPSRHGAEDKGRGRERVR